MTPSWIQALAGISGLVVGPRTGIAFGLVMSHMLQPVRVGTRFRWMVLDTIVAALCLVMVISVWLNTTFAPLQPLEVLRSIALPYVLGRTFLRRPSDVAEALPWFVGVGVAVACYGIVEALVKVNPLPVALGKSWPLLESAEGFRWGLKRAQGPANHPIYFGLMLAALLPWMLEGVRAYQRRLAPVWWQFAPLALIVAAFVTVSRAAQLSVVGVVVADFFVRKPKWRGPILVSTAVAAISFLAYRAEVIDALSALAGEEENLWLYPAKIEGVVYPYSGTRHRDLLEIAYGRAAESSGWFGYGLELRKADMPVDPLLDERFRSIDHGYLFILLRHGRLGLGLFMAAALLGLVYLATAAFWGPPETRILAGGLFGAALMVGLALRGVSMEEDFGWTWLFTLGVGARMFSWTLDRPALARAGSPVRSDYAYSEVSAV